MKCSTLLLVALCAAHVINAEPCDKGKWGEFKTPEEIVGCNVIKGKLFITEEWDTESDLAGLQRVIGDIYIEGGTHVKASELQIVYGDILLSSTSTVSITMPKLHMVQDLDLAWYDWRDDYFEWPEAYALAEIDFSSLVHADQISLQRVQNLAIVSFPSLRGVRDTIKIEETQGLQRFYGYQLGTVNSLKVVNNKDLVTVSVPELTTIPYVVDFTGNDKLLDVTLMITNFEDMYVRNNRLLRSFNLPKLTHSELYGSTTDFEFTRNPKLQKLVFPNFALHAGDITIKNNAALEEVSFPKLYYVEKGSERIRLIHNKKLDSVNFPQLIAIGGVKILGNKKLTQAHFPLLQFSEIYTDTNFPEIKTNRNGAKDRTTFQQNSFPKTFGGMYLDREDLIIFNQTDGNRRLV